MEAAGAIGVTHGVSRSGSSSHGSDNAALVEALSRRSQQIGELCGAITMLIAYIRTLEAAVVNGEVVSDDNGLVNHARNLMEKVNG